MLVYRRGFCFKAKNKKLAKVSFVTLIDNLIMFENLAIVNSIMIGSVDLYKKFAELLRKNNKTTYQVSKDTGIPTSTFSNWKAGR